MDEQFDYRTVTMTQDEYAADMLLDDIVFVAKTMSPFIYLNEANWDNPIVALAYKIHIDSKGEMH